MRNGWICLHRSLQDHWLWDDSDALKVWVYMLMEANHKERKAMMNGSLVTVKRGQLITGRIALAAKTSVSENKIRRYIKTLEKEGMIHQLRTSRFSLITVLNYDQYQENNQLKTSKAPAKHQQSTTPEQLNNSTIENIYNGFDFSSWPELPQAQIIDDWFKNRAAKKAPVTQTVINRFSKELKKAVEAGYSVNDCIGLAVVKGWQGFKFEWFVNEGKDNGSNQQAARSVSRNKGFSESDRALEEAFGDNPSEEGVIEASFERVEEHETSQQQRPLSVQDVGAVSC